jgi:DNA replication protein DnaD
MSWSAMEWAVEQDCGDAQSKIVLVVIAKHANKKLQSFPSVSRIAKLANMSPRSVHRKINRLQELGLLHVKNQGKDGKKTSNLYTLRVVTDSQGVVTDSQGVVTDSQGDTDRLADRTSNLTSKLTNNISSSIPDETDCHHQEEDEKETDWTSFANEILGKSNGRDDSKMGD